ncbi:MAG: GNAT family N-acetyltransferase [Anaerolineales bacterium]|jgi:ribosomal protein S18 acetylase RimI-like enzyme
MQVKSLGYRTDLFFPAFDGQIIDRGDYVVVKTPSNPTFYWGNFLLFADPPGEGDDQRWRELFAEEIGQPPQVMHQALGWDSTQGEAGLLHAFLDQGFHLEHGTVLTADPKDLSPKFSPKFSLRQLHSEADWEQSIENQVLCREAIFSEGGYRTFRQGQAARYRAMAAAGLGTWFGAFAGKQLVGDLGIFCAGNLARYQAVCTHPDFRRRGIASRLVYQAGRYAVEQHAVETLVIVAEADSPAQRLYQSLGFQISEIQMGVWKADEGND